jgi:prepilin-type N-terminal cleavage/methylation domain-containing protein
MSNLSCRRRVAAFTLVELLVVIAIIAILIGLLMPAVQKVRDSANRAKCINNMKQLNLALQQYESKQGKIPPSEISTNGKRTGLMIHFLPYIEQDNLWNLYDFNKNWYEQSLDLLTAQPEIFFCPSNPNKTVRADYAINRNGVSINGSGYGVCDYTAVRVLHTGSPSAYSLGLLAPYSPPSNQVSSINFQGKHGLLVLNTFTRTLDVTDGLSNTFSFVEDTGRPQRLIANKRSTGFYPASQSDVAPAWADSFHAMDYQGYSDSGTSAGGPCGMNCTNHNEIYSLHGTGSVFGFGDGSVKYIGYKVDAKILSFLCTKQGTKYGETNPTDY